MADANLASGDLVVDLAASLRTAAMVAGALGSAISLWTINGSLLWALGRWGSEGRSALASA